jgi:phosphoribosylaminoimidazolecarboxamide formyltransferase/IMP cyclohydrolase
VRPEDHHDREAWDVAVAESLAAARPDLVVLAGFMRWLGPAALAAFPGRILNLHPSLLPAFPGAHAIRDAIAAGATVTGVSVHVVDETRDGGPIVAQDAVPILPADDEASLASRIHATEHRLLPRTVRLWLGGAYEMDGGRVRLDPRAAAELPVPRRALLSVSDKTGLVPFASALDLLGFELVSTGGTARTLRDAGLALTEVAAVTGFPEMLGGRVKTLHPGIHGGVLADVRLPEHREALESMAIEPFELVVVNLYQFEAAARRPGSTEAELIEEIDIGGPALVRASAKNHGTVAVVTDPEQYDAVLAELRRDGRVGEATRRDLALAAFATTSGYDAAIFETLAGRFTATGDDPATVRPADGAPELTRTLRLELGSPLRYGENPHQSAALYHEPGATPASGPFATGVDLRQGKALSYNNILDASAAAGLARDLRGPACVIVKHMNPCGAAEATDILDAWEAALAGDPVSAFGGVVAVTVPIDAPLAERLTSLFLEVVVAPDVAPEATPILAARPNLRVVVDPYLGTPPVRATEYRSAGGGLLVTDSDAAPDDTSAWQVATTRGPTALESTDLDLAWRVARHVKSNAIVLVRDGAVVGVGGGQMSRVDSARLAVAKAGAERAAGASCASDAFYPFADGVEVCTDAGVTAFVQPGGSQRDAEVIAVAERAGAVMLLTGVRHFRH